jgi:4-aminobutyrate aminotransferase
MAVPRQHARRWNIGDNMSDVINRTKKVITPALGFDVNLTAEKAEGIYVWTDDGRKIMDFSCGIAVLNVGHRHPTVIAKMREQMDKYVHSGCSFFYEPLARAGELLSEVTPDGIEMFFPLNGGSETIDGAIKLLRPAHPQHLPGAVPPPLLYGRRGRRGKTQHPVD